MADWAMDLLRESILVIAKLSAPVLIFGLAVGVGVSIFQAATQIQEASLAFIPKLIAIFFALLFFGAWMLRVLGDFATRIYGNLGAMIR